jgi:hypothetical protein
LIVGAERQLLLFRGMANLSTLGGGAARSLAAAAVVAFFGGASACSNGQLGSPDQRPSGGTSGVTGGQSGGGRGGGAVDGSGGAGTGTGGTLTGTGGTLTGTGGIPVGGGSGGHEGVGGTQGNCWGSGGGAVVDPLPGSSGGAGTGGLCCNAPTNCLEGLCGNGVRDTCMAPSGPGSCPVYSFSEQCDGDDMDGQTCTSLGYGSGALVCSSTCWFDTTGCFTCAAGSPPVARCNVVPSTPYSLLSLAATASQTALAWIDQNGLGGTQIGFALLSSTLDVITTGSIFDAGVANNFAQGGGSAQIAALPSGWVVLATSTTSMTLYALDSTGNVVAHTAIDPLDNGFGVGNPFLVPQPNGVPLVMWQIFDTIYAALVSADGRSVSTPIQVPVDPNNYGGGGPSLGSATFAAGNFQAVVQKNCASGACVQIVSIAPNGTVAGSFEPAGVSPYWGSRLVSGAAELRLLYVADCGTTLTDPCLMWQRFGPTGAALSSPVLLEKTSTAPLPVSAVASGDDSYLSFDAQNYSSTVLHLASDGSTVAGPSVIASGGAWGAGLVFRGSDLVAGWEDTNGPYGIEVARLTP